MKLAEQMACAESPTKAAPEPEVVDSKAQAAIPDKEKEKGTPTPITYARSRSVALLKLALINRTVPE